MNDHDYDALFEDYRFEDDDCIDGDGELWPEHDYGSVECRRCGADLGE